MPKRMKPPSVSSRLQIEMVPLSKLMEWPGNPKEHDLDGLGESFERFGFVEPIVFDELSKRIVVGHGRREKLLAWKQSGKPAPERIEVRGKEWLVPVLRGVGFRNQHEAEAYLLGSNQLVIKGGYKASALAEMLSRHAEDASGIGFTTDEIGSIMKKAAKAAQGAFDDANAAVAKTGKVEAIQEPTATLATHRCPECGHTVVCR